MDRVCKGCGKPLPTQLKTWCGRSCRSAHARANGKGPHKRLEKPSAPHIQMISEEHRRLQAEMFILSRVGKLVFMMTTKETEAVNAIVEACKEKFTGDEVIIRATAVHVVRKLTEYGIHPNAIKMAFTEEVKTNDANTDTSKD